MNRFVFFFFCVLVLATQCSHADTSQYVLSWSEEFDQEEIDWNVWSKTPRGTSDWNNYMSSYDGLYAVENGALVLRGISTQDAGTAVSDTAQFITGGLWGKDKQSFGYGRIEICAKLDCGRGFWPAIWMLSQGGPWPGGGEIDIMEHLNSEEIVYQTVHSHYTYNLGIRIPKTSAHTAYNPGEYNVYGVEMEPDSLRFFVNDKYTFTYPRIQTDKEGQFPFAEREFYLILSAQLGGSWVGSVSEEDLPVALYVDWIRFYKKTN